MFFIFYCLFSPSLPPFDLFASFVKLNEVAEETVRNWDTVRIWTLRIWDTVRIGTLRDWDTVRIGTRRHRDCNCSNFGK